MESAYARPIVRLDILTNRQCSNGGVSSRHKSVDLYRDDVLISDIDPDLLDRAVEIVARNIGGSTIFHVEPVQPVNSNSVGWMAGGSYVTTSDSRFSQEAQRVGGQRFYGAMAFHDRQETPAQYRSLSI